MLGHARHREAFMLMVEKRRRGRPRLSETAREDTSIQSLDRAISLLSLIAGADGLTLTEAAHRADLAPSTAYRMLTTLERHGLVETDPVTQIWHVGAGTFRIGAAFLRRRKLADRARRRMEDLMLATGETANLGVLDPAGVMFVAQVETHQPIRAFFRPGSTGPMHASGVGKAILSQVSADAVAGRLGPGTLQAYTPRTLSTLPALLADLSAARARGYAIDDEERHAGMRCVAAAIFDEFGEPLAGVSVSGPSVRVTDEAIARFGPLVATAAADITAAIAGQDRRFAR
jgi:IclR family transcriptional regulator, acetate operon repressor